MHIAQAWPWLRDARPDASGMWHGGGGRWGIGTVLLLTDPAGALLMVQKAARPGYAFSDQWAFPGGMVRQPPAATGSMDGQDFGLSDALQHTLANRLHEECGLPMSTLLSPPRPLSLPCPPTSGYLARDAQRLVLVLPFHARAVARLAPQASAPSIQAARWWPAPPAWANIAPANRLILAEFLWPRLPAEGRAAALPHLEEAHGRCQVWAQQAQVPAPARWWA